MLQRSSCSIATCAFCSTKRRHAAPHPRRSAPRVVGPVADLAAPLPLAMVSAPSSLVAAVASVSGRGGVVPVREDNDMAACLMDVTREMVGSTGDGSSNRCGQRTGWISQLRRSVFLELSP